MAELVVSGLIITTGLCAVGVGIISAANRIQSAQRAHRRMEALHVAASGGWNAWFLGGFSGLTMGTQWFAALAVWLLWTIAGVGLISLGFRLFVRA